MSLFHASTFGIGSRGSVLAGSLATAVVYLISNMDKASRMAVHSFPAGCSAKLDDTPCWKNALLVTWPVIIGIAQVCLG